MLHVQMTDRLVSWNKHFYGHASDDVQSSSDVSSESIPHIHSCFFCNKKSVVQNLFTHPYTTHLKVNKTLGNWPLNFLWQFVGDFFLVQISAIKTFCIILHGTFTNKYNLSPNNNPLLCMNHRKQFTLATPAHETQFWVCHQMIQCNCTHCDKPTWERFIQSHQSRVHTELKSLHFTY